MRPQLRTACARVLNLGWQLGASEEESTRIFEDGLMLAERAGDFASQAKLNIAYAGIRSLNLGMVEDNVFFAGRAVALSHRLGDPLLQGSARLSLANGYVLAGRFGQAGELADRALAELPPDEAFVELGVSPRPIFLAFRAVSDHLTDSNRERVHRDLETAREIATEYGFVEIEVYLLSLVAWFAVLKGDGARAYQHAHAATEIAEGLGTGLARCHGLLARGRASLALGDDIQACEVFEEMIRVGDETRTGGAIVGSGLAGLAAALLALGEVEQARRRADEAVNYVRERKLAWDLMPWITQANVLIRADDRLQGEKAIGEAEALMREAGAIVYRPLLHEARAAYGARFKELWDPEVERAAASKYFARLGAK
jgi:tetratricopeptide (TPR) repeat protein